MLYVYYSKFDKDSFFNAAYFETYAMQFLKFWCGYFLECILQGTVSFSAVSRPMAFRFAQEEGYP